MTKLTKKERKEYNRLRYKMLDKDKHRERMREYMRKKRAKL